MEVFNLLTQEFPVRDIRWHLSLSRLAEKAARSRWYPAGNVPLLAEKHRQHNARAWLVNTGRSGGAHGTGERVACVCPRAILDAICSGPHNAGPSPVRIQCGDILSDVPAEILIPKNTWSGTGVYDHTARVEASLFVRQLPIRLRPYLRWRPRHRSTAIHLINTP